jgi:hypothetical protein
MINRWWLCYKFPFARGESTRRVVISRFSLLPAACFFSRFRLVNGSTDKSTLKQGERSLRFFRRTFAPCLTRLVSFHLAEADLAGIPNSYRFHPQIESAALRFDWVIGLTRSKRVRNIELHRTTTRVAICRLHRRYFSIIAMIEELRWEPGSHQLQAGATVSSFQLFAVAPSERSERHFNIYKSWAFNEKIVCGTRGS